MSEEKSLLDILMDENDTDNIVLYNENGEAEEFEQIAVIPMGEELYCILRPVNGEKYQMAADEAVVFRWDDEIEALSVETDLETAQKVFEEFYKMCDEYSDSDND